MNGRIRLSLAMAFAVMFLGVLAATAQPLTWNPPCGTLRVKNVTGVPVSISLNTTPPGAIPAPIVVGPFSDVTVGPPLPAGMTVNSANSFTFPPPLQLPRRAAGSAISSGAGGIERMDFEHPGGTGSWIVR